MKYGILLTRAQPIHKGHIDVIQTALKENDRVLVVIGSANKEGTKRNPFPIVFRKQMVLGALYDYHLEEKVDILTLSDWSMEDAYQYAKEWGSFFYYNVVNTINEKTFTIYYNDNPDIVRNWFVPEIAERITVKCAERVRDASGTQIREAIEKYDLEYLADMLCPSTFGRLTAIRKMLANADKDDYIMD